jgi:hypothetical protein
MSNRRGLLKALCPSHKHGLFHLNQKLLIHRKTSHLNANILLANLPVSSSSFAMAEMTHDINSWMDRLKNLIHVNDLDFPGITDFLPLLPPRKTNITLIERKTTMKEIKQCWKVRQNVYCNNTHDSCRDASEKELKIPICIGMYGVRKTRLLHEYPQIFQSLGIKTKKKNTLGILISYNHGHGPIPREQDFFSFSTSLGWRLLYRFFAEPRPVVVRKETNVPLFTAWMNELKADANLQCGLLIYQLQCGLSNMR